MHFEGFYNLRQSDAQDLASALCLMLLQGSPSMQDLEQSPTLDLRLSLPSLTDDLPVWKGRRTHLVVRCRARTSCCPRCMLRADASKSVVIMHLQQSQALCPLL